MSGRGRGRPSRSAQESAAGPSRRSTRNQQQQQQQHEDDELDSASQQAQQESGDRALEQQRQPEALMSVPEYHQPIDPAITGSQDASMPPPPIPSAKNPRGQGGLNLARRGTRRDVRAESIGSINSAAVTDVFSSQPEPQNSAPQRAFAASALGALGRASSVSSSGFQNETPARKAVRARLMNKMLPRLLDAIDDLYDHFSRDRGEDAESWDMEREGLKGAFDAYRAHYVRDVTNPIVDPTFVAEAMGLNRDSQAWDTTFRAIVAANLISLLNDITPIDEQNILAVLQQWDLWFLNVLFEAGPDIWDKPTKEAIIEQVLMIRTQLSIFTLQRLNDESPAAFHPFQEVARIWCDGDVSVEAIEGFMRNDNDAPPFKPVMEADPEVDALLKDRTESRFRSICSMLPDRLVEAHNLDLVGVQGGYPLSEFDQEMRKFVRHCFAVVRPSAQQGPSAGPGLPFSHSEDTSRADSQIRSQLEPDAVAHQFSQAGPSAPSYNLDTLRLLKQYEQQASAGYGDSQQLSPIPPVPYPGDFNTPAPVGYADPQLHAALAPNGTLYADSAAQVSVGRKRRTQDETASGAPGPAKKSRARRKKNDAPVPAPASSAPSGLPAAPSQYPPMPPMPGTQDEPDFDAVAQRTRELSAAARKVREPQVRSPWVRKDVSLLVKAVFTYQAKWSTIEKEIKAGTIPFERPRDQQALRDKARLLKQDFLKVDGVLPRGFDLVVLGKKEREAVMACGKNPDRKEADLDANGQPVNTELGGEEAAAPPAAAAQLPPQVQHEPQHDPQLEAPQDAQPEPQMAVPQAPLA